MTKFVRYGYPDFDRFGVISTWTEEVERLDGGILIATVETYRAGEPREFEIIARQPITPAAAERWLATIPPPICAPILMSNSEATRKA